MAVSLFKPLAKELSFRVAWAHYPGTHFLLGFPSRTGVAVVLVSPTWFTPQPQHGPGRLRRERCSHSADGEGRDDGSEGTVTAWPPPYQTHCHSQAMEKLRPLIPLNSCALSLQRGWSILKA